MDIVKKSKFIQKNSVRHATLKDATHNARSKRKITVGERQLLSQRRSAQDLSPVNRRAPSIWARAFLEGVGSFFGLKAPQWRFDRDVVFVTVADTP